MPTQITFHLKIPGLCCRDDFILPWKTQQTQKTNALKMIFIVLGSLTQKTNAQRIIFIVLGSLTNWCLIYIKTVKINLFVILLGTDCFSVIISPYSIVLARSKKKVLVKFRKFLQLRKRTLLSKVASESIRVIFAFIKKSNSCIYLSCFYNIFKNKINKISA